MTPSLTIRTEKGAVKLHIDPPDYGFEDGVVVATIRVPGRPHMMYDLTDPEYPAKVRIYFQLGREIVQAALEGRTGLSPRKEDE